MLLIPVNTNFFVSKLHTEFEMEGGRNGNLYSYGESKVVWNMEYHLNGVGSHNIRSNMQFFDDKGLTQKLIADAFFNSRLPDVYKLQINGLTILVGNEPSSKYERIRHLVKIVGRGHHSFVEYEPSDFTYEAYSTEPMNKMVSALIRTATQVLE